MHKPKTLPEQLLFASNILWWMGTLMTGGLTYMVAKAVIESVPLALIAAGIGASAIQYVLSLMETALWDGSLPPIWRVRWGEGGPIVSTMLTAVFCLALDIVLNLGGVGFVMSKLGETNIGQKQFGMSAGFVQVLINTFTILFSLLISVGPEQLRQRALALQGVNNFPQPLPSRKPSDNQRVEQGEVRTRGVHSPEKEVKTAMRVINSRDLNVEM